MSLHNFHTRLPNWLLISAAVFMSVIFICAAGGLVFAEVYRDKIMPGVMVAGQTIGGQTPLAAKLVIEKTINQLNDQGVEIRFRDQAVSIPRVNIPLSPDASAPLVSFNTEETLKNAYAIGRQKNWLINFFNRLGVWLVRRPIEIALVADQENILALLQKEFADFNQPAQNATIVFTDDEPRLVEEQAGQLLKYEQAVLEVLDHLRNADTTPVEIVAIVDEPTITLADAQSALPQLESFLNFSNSKLVYEKKQWLLDKTSAKDWLGFEKNNNKTKIVLDQEKIKQYLTKEVASKINQEPIDAKLSITNGRVSVWQAGQDGLEIDLAKTAAEIARWPDYAKASSGKPQDITVVIKEVRSAAVDATAEELGLKEIIGTGISQFSGSPANRRHNIRVGADSLHGLLIKPGEEFSLLKALGEIDAKHGYLPELVIKENKTIPEYGGGLCQIGTTMFRVTFNSGLPVTARRNHSYRVVYYEPAGTDATIYNPAPDYRFINDTGHHILIQARIEGDQLAFDFWGTKDGRQVEFTKPVIYNIVSPGPTKIIETTDLPEGQKKCTEGAHNGADAYFDYKVTYPDGEVKEERFTSHYVPWRAVCLVGVKELKPEGGLPSSPTGTVTPSVTPEVTP